MICVHIILSHPNRDILVMFGLICFSLVIFFQIKILTYFIKLTAQEMQKLTQELTFQTNSCSLIKPHVDHPTIDHKLLG